MAMVEAERDRDPTGNVAMVEVMNFGSNGTNRTAIRQYVLEMGGWSTIRISWNNGRVSQIGPNKCTGLLVCVYGNELFESNGRTSSQAALESHK